MPETVYNVEIKPDNKWWYHSQHWTLEYAISVASRLKIKARIRKVVKTVVWKQKK